MKTDRFHDVPSLALPRGQFLHRDVEWPLFELVGRRDDSRLWITALEFSDRSRAAGPFEPHEAVRALRLANLSIPDGCELGPWQDGLGFFSTQALPGALRGWEPVQPAWLEPSVTRYESDDITGEEVSTCCAVPTKPPRVIWDDEDPPDPNWVLPPDFLDFALNPIHARHPQLKTARIGVLEHAWNGHPENCLVWAPSGVLQGGFYVADFDLGVALLRRGNPQRIRSLDAPERRLGWGKRLRSVAVLVA